MSLIALISPVKNEIANLPQLVSSIEKQSLSIAHWIFVNDSSDDGSLEFILKIKTSITNVEHVSVISTTGLPQQYALGSKYSIVVNHGFEYLASYQIKVGVMYDYIGILDADCFVENNYYEHLIEKFILLPKLGIASGFIYVNIGNRRMTEKSPQRWARGGVRLWRKKCFDESGYMIGMSADALSSAKAWINGWQIQSFKDALVESREVGSKSGMEYFGKTAYYRYIPTYFIILKCLFYIMLGRHRFVKAYLKGYYKAVKEKKRNEIEDKRIIGYFRFLPWRIVYENIVIIRNLYALKMAKKRNSLRINIVKR